MQYKTMTLELIRSRERLHSVLKARKAVLPTMEHYAKALRNRHLEWVEELRESRPELDEMQRRSMALELALQEFENHFDLLVDQAEAFDLDDAMAHLRENMPAE